MVREELAVPLKPLVVVMVATVPFNVRLLDPITITPVVMVNNPLITTSQARFTFSPGSVPLANVTLPNVSPPVLVMVVLRPAATEKNWTVLPF